MISLLHLLRTMMSSLPHLLALQRTYGTRNCRLTQLAELNLTECEIVDLPPHVSELKQLTVRPTSQKGCLCITR
jgi:hypothetical protein